MVLRTARYVDEPEEVEFGEISVFLSPRFVITVRQGVASDLHDARLRLEQRPGCSRRARRGAVGDPGQGRRRLRPGRRGLERDIDDVEKTVFSGARAPTQRIYLLRREVTDFYRAVHPLLARATRSTRRARRDAGLRQYFRDVDDHLKLVNEEVAAQRDLLTTVLEANMAEISVEQNEVVRKISAGRRSSPSRRSSRRSTA